MINFVKTRVIAHLLFTSNHYVNLYLPFMGLVVWRIYSLLDCIQQYYNSLIWTTAYFTVNISRRRVYIGKPRLNSWDLEEKNPIKLMFNITLISLLSI